jgi:hypothetical protein
MENINSFSRRNLLAAGAAGAVISAAVAANVVIQPGAQTHPERRLGAADHCGRLQNLDQRSRA